MGDCLDKVVLSDAVGPELYLFFRCRLGFHAIACSGEQSAMFHLMRFLVSLLSIWQIPRGASSFKEGKNPDRGMLTARLLEWLQKPVPSGLEVGKTLALQCLWSSSFCAFFAAT